MDRVGSRIFTVLMAVVMLGVIFSVLTDSRNSILIKEMFYVAGGSLAALLGGILLLSGARCSFRRLPPVSVAALAGIILFSMLRHQTGIGSVNGPFTVLMLLSLSVITVTSVLFMKREDFRLLTGIFMASSVILFVYALLQWQGVNIFQWDAALTRSGRSTGSLGNPNLLGGFASAAIPLGTAWIFTLPRRSLLLKRLLAAFYALLGVFAIIASGTRGSLLGLLAGCTALAIWYIRRNSLSPSRVVAVVVVAALIVGFAAFPMSSRLSELDPDAEDQGTLQVRKLIWSGAVSVFMDSPLFGHGPGSFQILYPAHRDPDYNILGVSHNTLHAHCEYLEILVDLGLTGLLLWGLAVFFLMKRLRSAAPLAAGAFAGMAAMLAEGLVSVHLRWPPTAWLFAFLTGVYLAGEDEGEKPGGWRFIWAVALIAAGAVLALGYVNHYVPSMKASRLVFTGKDIYLNRTESAMQAAYAAAGQWQTTGNPGALEAALEAWTSAAAFADSAVENSRRGTETYPPDLGGWYALGSAHLTRFMIMEPPVPALRTALEQAEWYTGYTPEELSAELARGMAAYDTLVSMAPNYAEVHNNLALGYSNMGLPGESMEALYRAYLLHGHRRSDYYEQARSLLPLAPGSVPGLKLIFHHRVRGIDVSATGGRLDYQTRETGITASFCYASIPGGRDSLEGVFMDILYSELPDSLAEVFAGSVRGAPETELAGVWRSGEIEALSPEDKLLAVHEDLVLMAFPGACFPGQFPVDSGFYAYPAGVLLENSMDRGLFQSVMDIYLLQMEIDRNLDGTFTLFMSRRFRENASPGALEGLNLVRNALGGSRTALRSSVPMPWLSGSLPGIISDTLHALQMSDPGRGQWYEMELELCFLAVSSYWWDQQIFASPQNQYLLERLFACRDSLAQIDPDHWQSGVTAATQRTLERIEYLTSPTGAAILNELQTDLVSGSPRSSP